MAEYATASRLAYGVGCRALICGTEGPGSLVTRDNARQ